MSVKRAIVSFANNRGNYYDALARLGNSLKDKAEGIDFFGFMGEHSIGAPRHDQDPYAFKVYAINYVRKLGYRQIVWLDSSVVAVRNVKPVFDVLDKEGYIMQEAGHMAGKWCNDKTLEYFGLTREEAMKIPMYGNAGFLGLDFKHEPSKLFFYNWILSMKAGMFRGSWENHRHDMTCGSLIAARKGINFKFKSGNEWLDYAPPDKKPKNDTIIFHAAGM